MDLHRHTDEALIALRGPEAGAAFGVLYGRHEALIVAIHRRRVRDAETAADLAAETFAQALASRRRFTDGGPGSGVRWLYGIAGNVLRRSIRQLMVEQRKLEKLRLDRPPLDDAAIAAVDAAASEGAVLAALELLPEDQRIVVRGLVLDDQSYDELAGRLELQPATVRKRASRGLQALRRDLEETR